jgi:mono/diheme cytochrome c family protein
MRHLLTATLAATLLGAVGCVEPLDAPGTTNPTLPKTDGEVMFDNDISPILEQKCASCHTGAPESTPTKFLGATGKADNYAKVTFDDGVIGGWDPALAALLTKGEHAGGAGPAWGANAAAKIEAWMVQEALDRNITIDPPVPPVPPGPPVYDARQALAKFAACMAYADWTSSQVYTWSQKRARGANGDDACADCHTDGAGGGSMPNDENRMFNLNRTELFIKHFFAVKPLDLGDLSKGYEVVINEVKLKDKATRQGDGHPDYTYNANDVYVQRLTDFYTKTKARLATCTTEPAFPEPPAGT